MRFPRLWHVLALLIVLFGVTYLGVSLGWFEGLYFIDIPLHVAGGIILGILWWWLINKFSLVVGEKIPTLFSFVGFVTFVSFLWEIYEYVNLKYFAKVTPKHELFSPTLSDVISDFGFALLGSLIAFIIFSLYQSRKKKLDSVTT